jgi:L-fuculose-phosphate aldolase
MSFPYDEKEQIILVGRWLDQKGMIAGSDGNISVRVAPNQILITPGGISKGRMIVEDLVTVDLEGNKINGQRNPSSEMAMHLFTYRSRPDINACVHAHPPYATSFSVAGKPLPNNILPEIVVFVGDIPLTDFAPPGTQAVPKSLDPYIVTNNAFLLKNHGLLTIGKNLEEAFQRHEIVEHYAHILWLAAQLGDIKPLPDEELLRLSSLRAQMLKRPNNDKGSS